MGKSIQLKDSEGNVYPIVKERVAYLNLSTNRSLSNNGIVPFDEFYSSTPEITNQSNGFKIGKNISKIKISGNMGINWSAGTGKVYGYTILKNGAGIVGVRCHKSLGEPISGSSADNIISVNENDVITMSFVSTGGTVTVNNGTSMTITVIE